MIKPHSEYHYTKAVRGQHFTKQIQKSPAPCLLRISHYLGRHLVSWSISQLSLHILRATHALGQGLWDWLGGQTWGLQLLLKVSFKHLWTLPCAPGSHHRLKQKHWRQRGSSEARVSQGATAFQVAWQSSLQKILAAWGRAEGFRSIHPFRGRRSTDTRHTMFSLWGNSIWKHYWEKESTETR